MDLDLQAYAAVAAALASSGEARATVLGRYGLEEASWEEIDAAWQARLSEALEADEGDGVPELVAAHAAAYAEAQRTIGPVIGLDQFAEITRLFQATGDLRASAAKAGVGIGDYVRASAHWSGRMAEDPALQQRFAEVVGGRVAGALGSDDRGVGR